MNIKIDLTGKKFNKLQVIEFVGKNKKNANSMWKCSCDCGGVRIVAGPNLTGSVVKSCKECFVFPRKQIIYCRFCKTDHPRTKEFFSFSKQGHVHACKKKLNKTVTDAKKKSPKKRLAHNIRNRIRFAIKGKGWKKGKKLVEYIGCSLEELKLYFESKFLPRMSWNNYGKWHIDHIVPLSSAKNIKEMMKLCHYTNLQPLWAKDNISKGNKL